MGAGYFVINALIVAAAYAIGGKTLAVMTLWCWGLFLGTGVLAVGLRKLITGTEVTGAVLALAGSGLLALSLYHVRDGWRTESGITILAMVAISAISFVVHLITKR